LGDGGGPQKKKTRKRFVKKKGIGKVTETREKITKKKEKRPPFFTNSCLGTTWSTKKKGPKENTGWVVCGEKNPLLGLLKGLLFLFLCFFFVFGGGCFQKTHPNGTTKSPVGEKKKPPKDLPTKTQQKKKETGDQKISKAGWGGVCNKPWWERKKKKTKGGGGVQE